MTLRSFRSGAAVLGLVMSLAAISAADRLIDPKSTLSATFTVEKVPVEAPFHKFSGRIDYDPANDALAPRSHPIDNGDRPCTFPA